MMMSTGESSPASPITFGGAATGAVGPQFNTGKTEKLPADIPAVPHITESSESENERVLGIFLQIKMFIFSNRIDYCNIFTYFR